jgi:hypothetical protein
MLVSAGIAYFRMVEFTSCSGQFSSWKRPDGKPDEERRRPFLHRLISTVVKYAEHSFAAGVLLRHWDRCNRDFELAEQDFQPYSLCGWTCIDGVYRWCEERGYSRDQVLLFFEDGDRDRGHLEARAKNDFGAHICFGGKIPKPNDPPLLPLQAADFAAWHVRRVLDEQVRFGTVTRVRFDFEELFSRVPYDGYHRHFSMMAGRQRFAEPGEKTPLAKSIGVPSLVKFCLEYGVPARADTRPLA